MKKHIAIFLSTSGHSGVDRLAKNLTQYLLASGFRVDLLKVRKHGPHLEKLQHANFRIIDLKTKHTLLAFGKIKDYLNTEKPSILFSDKDRVNRTALLSQYLAKHKPTLIFSSGTTLSIDLAHRGALERFIQKASFKYLYPKAKTLLVPCQAVKEDTSQFTGLKPKQIQVAPCPVVADEVFKQSFPVPEHPWFADKSYPLLLSLSEISQRKGIDTILQAFKIVAAKTPVRLIIAGRGKQSTQFEQLAIDLGIHEQVDFIGFVDQPYSYLQHADLFLFASRWEGLGFTLIESLSVGTPVVATDCPSGPREILHNGQYGKLVPVNDYQAFAQAILEQLNLSSEPDDLKQAALPYSISQGSQTYLNAFGFCEVSENHSFAATPSK